MKRRGLRALSLMALALGAGGLAAQPQERPAVLDDVRIEQRLNEQISAGLEFRDEAGRTVRLGDYFGRKPTILVLAYYKCPKLCGLVLNGLRESLDLIEFDAGKQFQVVVVSFDPREKPALAAKKKEVYVSLYGRPGAEEGWHFLTGDPEPIRQLCDAAGFFYAYDAKNDQYVHASAIMVLTPEGKLSRYFYGVKYVPSDVRLGLVEASERKIGTPVDSVLLYCFHYDPARGKYTADVMRFVRIGGAATVLGLVAMCAFLLRRERRQARAGGQAHAAQTEGEAGRP
jgi:protein SCO1/2